MSWTVIGLLVEMVGVLMIFVWGPPQPDLSVYDVVIASEDKNPSAVRKRTFYRIMSFIALGLIFVGLCFQLYDAWPQLQSWLKAFR